MMEQRRALTIPFSVDKDKLMENPLRIPMTCLSSEYAKLGRQVSWTALSGCKHKNKDLHHKNGSTRLDHNHSAMVRLELDRRKPCLVLTDVLKTEDGKAYIERKTKSFQLRNRSTRRQSGHSVEEPQIRKGARSAQKSGVKDNGNKSDQKTAHRSNFRRKLQFFNKVLDKQDDKEEESTDVEEVITGKDLRKDDKFAEVVDCGFSVSWEPDEDTGGHEKKSSPGSVKDKLTDSEEESQQSLKRKMTDMLFSCNGTSSPKRQRESVLRLTGEDRKNGGPASTRNCLNNSGEDEDLEALDRTIVQFTVGADDRKEIVLGPDEDAEDVIGSPSQSPSSNRDNETKTRTSEPIVLSSDEEESGDVPRRCSPVVRSGVTDTVIQGQSPQKAQPKEQDASDTEDMQVLQVFIDLPARVATSPVVDDSCMNVAFSTLHCGCYKVKSNGNLMLTDTKFIIPLKDTSGQVVLMFTLERKELRRYSVWEQHEMEAQGLCFQGDDDPFPPSVLLFCVSETAAAAVQRDLLKLCVKPDRKTSTGEVSPFILLTLKDPLEGMEGALLRSLLDIDCLNSIADEKSLIPQYAERPGVFDDILTPVLSLDESIELITRTGLDARLLTQLGLVDTDTDTDAEPGSDTEQDVSLSEKEDDTAAITQLQVNSPKETVVEPQIVTEDTGTQQKLEEDQKEREDKNPSEKKEEATAAYTLCHARTKGSYSVSLCKPDSSWIKYKHKGLTRRLIQFPPPPLKGGITVTMEDLQCLDSGQFLNDVIIDFYLKYLLQMTSAAVAERSHIFSSFFYKQLTRRDNASEGMASESCQRQRRHQRVKTWTRHVDIFKKDFVFVPVNQEAHWYLVVICFPGLEEPKSEAWKDPDSQTGRSQTGSGRSPDPEVAQRSKSPNDNKEAPPSSDHSGKDDTDTEDAPEKSTKDSPPGPVNCTEQTCQKEIICKRPCILIMDSLKLSLHERVFKILREYLQSEWEVRRGSSRDFSPDQMQSSHCQVPLQDNSSDCGLYLLQYVESFLKDPVVHFDLPLRLEHWFPRQQVRRKRDEIRDLVLNLYRDQNLDSNT